MAMLMNPGVKNEMPDIDEELEREAIELRNQYVPFPIPDNIPTSRKVSK